VTLAQRCENVAALIVDVDGVLTAGGITYAAGGQEIKEFHVRDGSGMKIWLRTGKPLAILSGRQSDVTALRARELGIVQVEQGNADKIPGFRRLLEKWGVDAGRVAYVGDDVPDVPLLEASGLAVAVADACSTAIRTAHYVTRMAGGQGAVREAIELILRCQGQWPATSPQEVKK
jgi:3-deoxy-D-manno-octulosonate 8-phosphate phosphatase (KDO 8-P phosphatase)